MPIRKKDPASYCRVSIARKTTRDERTAAPPRCGEPASEPASTAATPEPTPEPRRGEPASEPASTTARGGYRFLSKVYDFHKLLRALDEPERTCLAKRVQSCDTFLGRVANVHLEKVDSNNILFARNVYTKLFECYHVVMGDMNSTWSGMIGGMAQSRHSFASSSQERACAEAHSAWVDPAKYHATTRYEGTYLPAVMDADRAIQPPAFDLVVARRPLKATSLPKQPGKAFVKARVPRGLMHTLDWPSDHTSVVAEVECVFPTRRKMTVAIWNVADPWYFSRFFPCGPANGFVKEDEEYRLDAIREHVRVLLDVSDVVGLQEVPHALVALLVRDGTDHEKFFRVQWQCSPSQDDPLYEHIAGLGGVSTKEIPRKLPRAAHNMMFCGRAVGTEA